MLTCESRVDERLRMGGVPEDDAEAAKWCRKAAEQRLAEGQLMTDTAPRPAQPNIQ